MQIYKSNTTNKVYFMSFAISVAYYLPTAVFSFSEIVSRDGCSSEVVSSILDKSGSAVDPWVDSCDCGSEGLGKL